MASKHLQPILIILSILILPISSSPIDHAEDQQFYDGFLFPLKINPRLAWRHQLERHCQRLSNDTEAELRNLLTQEEYQVEVVRNVTQQILDLHCGKLAPFLTKLCDTYMTENITARCDECLTMSFNQKTLSRLNLCTRQLQRVEGFRQSTADFDIQTVKWVLCRSDPIALKRMTDCLEEGEKSELESAEWMVAESCLYSEALQLTGSSYLTSIVSLFSQYF